MNLKLSEDFKLLLTRIKNNKVANKLLNSEFDTKKINYNYIGLGDTNKLVSFTPETKVEKILEELPMYFTINAVRNLTYNNSNNAIFEALGYDKDANEYWYPQDPATDRGTILRETVSKSSGRTYVLYKCNRTGRLAVINKEAIIEKQEDDSFLFETNRNSIKVGRLASHMLTSIDFDYTTKDIEDFVNLYKASYDFMGNKSLQFEIVSGMDIAWWYNHERYQSGGGVLNNSCMSSRPDSTFELYTENSCCKMIILYADDGEIVGDLYKAIRIKGRALLWDVKYKGDSIKFMDRVYTTNDSDVELFKEYAKTEGWWFKEEQSMYPNARVTDGETITDDRFEVVLEKPDFKYHPYMDTMCHWVNGCLTNSFDKKHTKTFRCTNGSHCICEDGREIRYADISNV